MEKAVQQYVPGYSLKQAPQFENIKLIKAEVIPGNTATEIKKVSIFLEVVGAGFYLPEYAGNLDIMTSAAMSVGDRIASHLLAQ